MNPFNGIQCFKISDSEYGTIKKNIFTSKNSMIKELLKLIIKKDLNITPRIDTVIFFPGSLTMAERHSMYKYGQKDCIKVESQINNGEKCIFVILNPKYLTGLAKQAGVEQSSTEIILSNL